MGSFHCKKMGYKTNSLQSSIPTWVIVRTVLDRGVVRKVFGLTSKCSGAYQLMFESNSDNIVGDKYEML